MTVATSFTADATEAAAAAGEFLRTDPVRHNVICTLLDAAVAEDTPIRFWWSSVDAEVRGAVFQSLGRFPAVGSTMDDRVIAPLAATIGAASPEMTISAIGGPAAETAHFAGEFASVTRRPAVPVEGQRIYEVRRVAPPAAIEGSARLAGSQDRDLVTAWIEGFERDTGDAGGPGRDDAARANRYIQTQRLHLWEHDGVPRGCTFEQSPSAGVSRVSLVYTPPEHRNRGYASALVAHVSTGILGRGHHCILYTQLENPTSNAVYQAIGYEPVAEIIRYRFD
jgi:GNAT superfamily N-acetyltransferase